MSTSDLLRERPPQVGLWTRFRSRYVPDHIFGEILAKPWVDTFIPALVLAAVVVVLAVAVPNFFELGSITILARVLGEFIILAIGQTIVMIGGGIDLSVGSVFGLCNFLALALVYQAKLHVLAALPLTVLLGAAIGGVNGILIGYLRLRAFLTTLVTLIIVRAGVDWWGMLASAGLVSDSDVNGEGIFDFLGDGSVFGIPSSLVAAIVLAISAHVFLSRTRVGVLPLGRIDGNCRLRDHFSRTSARAL